MTNVFIPLANNKWVKISNCLYEINFSNSFESKKDFEKKKNKSKRKLTIIPCIYACKCSYNINCLLTFVQDGLFILYAFGFMVMFLYKCPICLSVSVIPVFIGLDMVKLVLNFHLQLQENAVILGFLEVYASLVII